MRALSVQILNRIAVVIDAEIVPLLACLVHGPFVSVLCPYNYKDKTLGLFWEVKFERYNARPVIQENNRTLISLSLRDLCCHASQ